jgi:phage protein D
MTVSTAGGPLDNNWLGLLSGSVAVVIYIRSQWTGSDVTMFTGLADSIAIDPINNTARILGRDYSSVLINSMYQDSFCNQSASEIANYIAARHGFDTNITTTSTMAGSYQCDSYNQILLNAHSRIGNEWDLLTHLAKVEGFELFVDGTALIFAPSMALPNNSAAIDVRDLIATKFFKVCPLSDQTRLTVKSWNSWLGQALSHTDDQPSDESVLSISDLHGDLGTNIAIVRPNLTAQGAEQLAKRHLDTSNQEALTIQITMPGEMSLKPRDLLTITGGFVGFDTNYIVKSVRRHFSTSAGFLQYVQGFAVGANSPLSDGGNII